MNFWDSSALLALVQTQPSSEEVVAISDADPGIVHWWAARVEVASGLCRMCREGVIGEAALTDLLAEVEQLLSGADEIEPTELIRFGAVRVLRAHGLRAADAMQLAAALAWTDNSPSGAGFVCLDKRLREAAEKEGFTVLPG